MNKLNSSPIIPNTSLLVKDSTRFWLNRSQSLAVASEGFEKDSKRQKALKYQYISSLSINTSLLPGRTRAMPAYVPEGARGGCVKDSREALGTSGPDSSREARGNSHQANHSLFYLSEL